MRKFCFILLVFCTVNAASQKKTEIRLHGYAAYVFDDHVDSYYSNTSYYNGTVQAHPSFGAGLEFMAHPSMGIELTYLKESTTAPTTYYDASEKSKSFDLDISYLLIGTNRYFPTTNKSIEPYFGFGLGAGFVNVSNPTSGSETSATKFAWSVKGGTNIWASPKFGVKLQAGLVSIAQGAGGGIYFGTGGVSPGLSTYSSILQFSLGGGLVFKFGAAEKEPTQAKDPNM